MRNHLAVLIALLFGLLLLGLIALQGAVLALAIPLVAYLGAAVWFAPEKGELEAQRQASSDWISAGTPQKVRLVVRNIGMALEEMMLTDPLPPGVELLEGKNEVFASLQPGDELELEYTVRALRGEYRVTHTLVTAMETFGLFGRKTRLDAPMSLRVKPTPINLKSIPIRPPQTRGFAGPIPSRQGGAGVEFFSVREYQPGDSQRSINWRIAARHPFDLYTNVHQMERVADVGLIVDARVHVNVRSGGDSLFEHGVQAAAALAGAFLDDGNRVGLLIYGSIIRSVFPGYGKVQRERILEALARAEVGHNYALEHLEYLPTRFFPTRSQIVLISPLIVDDIPVLIQLRARGYAVLVVCPDPIDFDARTSMRNRQRSGDQAAEYAYRIAHTERVFMLQRARRAGIQIVDWRVDEPLGPALQSAVQRQPIQHYAGGRP